MRLPHLQLKQEAFGLARRLGALLGVDEFKTLGHLCHLWAAALEWGPREAPPTGIIAGPLAARMLAGAIGWTGDVDLLTSALVACGAVEALSDGYRVRGLDAYEATFRKAEKDRTRKSRGVAAVSSGIPMEVARNSDGTPGESQGHTHTHTQTQRKETTLSPARARGQDEATPRASWAIFLQHACEARAAEPRRWSPDFPDGGTVSVVVERTLAEAVTRGLAPDKAAAVPLLCMAYDLHVEKAGLQAARAPWRFFAKDALDLMARAKDGRPGTDPPRSIDPPKPANKWAGMKPTINGVEVET